MDLQTLHRCISGYLSGDFTDRQRGDMRSYALKELFNHGVMVGCLCVQPLPAFLVEIEVQLGMRQAVPALAAAA